MTALTDHDCAHRSNTLGSQMNNLQGLVHKVGLVDNENGRVVSDDPNTLEAQVAEATGDARFCGKTVGTLNLMEIDGEKLLVGNSHGFFEDGELLCDDKVGQIQPDIQYGPNNKYGIDFTKGYDFEMPPLNHDEALKKLVGKTDSNRLNDLVVLRVKDTSLFERQVGGERKTIQLVNTAHEELKEIAEATTTFTMARRSNFENYRKVSVQYGCEVNDFTVNGNATGLKKHSCDTGPNASGSSINFLDAGQNIHSLGIHYGGADSTYSDFTDSNSTRGNFFIPSESVIGTVRRALRAESESNENTN